MTTSRILIVDDEPNLSSSHALSVARDFGPNLALLDVDMPGEDGGQVASEIKQDAWLGDVLIRFCTSLISRAEAGALEIIRHGNRYLTKPLDFSVLIAVLDQTLGDALHAA